MTLKTYFVYVIDTEVDKKLEVKCDTWHVDDTVSYSCYDQYSHYTEYKREIENNGIRWSICLRKLLQLNSVMAIISCSDNEVNDISLPDTIFSESIKGISFIGLNKFIFKVYENDSSRSCENALAKSYYIYSEINGKDIFCKVNFTDYVLKVNGDTRLIEAIKNNLFLLLALSEIIKNREHFFLRENIFSNPSDFESLIRTIFSYKMVLLKCTASQRFPLLFKNNFEILDSFIHHCQMESVINQTKTLNSQQSSIDDQTALLKQIHRVESGILLLTVILIGLTFVLIIDIILNIYKDYPEIILYISDLVSNYSISFL